MKTERRAFACNVAWSFRHTLRPGFAVKSRVESGRTEEAFYSRVVAGAAAMRDTSSSTTINARTMAAMIL